MVIKRFLKDDYLKRIKKDFKFFFKYTVDKDFIGEFDFALRENYFNIYYKGNSLAKIKPTRREKYVIEINMSFIDKKAFSKFDSYLKIKNNVYKYELPRDKIHSFLQKKNLKRLRHKIKDRAFQEEISFEQSIITDNLENNKLLIIDRQVRDKTFRKKIDLLALKHIERNKYSFLILELKLGINPELEEKVDKQLNLYQRNIDKCFDDYKKCYELHYFQKYDLGLIKNCKNPNIEIVKPVTGIVVVGGYKFLAEEKIKKLQKKYPSVKIVKLFYELNL